MNMLVVQSSIENGQFDAAIKIYDFLSTVLGNKSIV